MVQNVSWVLAFFSGRWSSAPLSSDQLFFRGVSSGALTSPSWRKERGRTLETRANTLSDELKERQTDLRFSEVFVHAPLNKVLPSRPQALLVGPFTVDPDQLLRKVLREQLGHLWTGAGKEHPIRAMLLASDWLLGLEALPGTDRA